MARNQKRPPLVVKGKIPPEGRVPVVAIFRSGKAIGFRDLTRFPLVREKAEAVRIARETLRKPNADPECNACVVARQLLEALKVDL